MSDKDLEEEEGTKRFDIYLHLNEEMKVVKDVCDQEYTYQQLILDAHNLALLQFPKCSKESVFVSHERRVAKGGRCKTPLTCDYGLKRLFSSNQSAYVFFVKCYDHLPGLRLLEKVKRSYKLSLVEEVDSSDSDQDLIKQASTSPVENVPLGSTSEIAEERRITTMEENVPLVSTSEIAEENRITSPVENVPLGSTSGIAEERRITTMVENVPLASIAEVEEERMLVYPNQLDQFGDQTNHVSVTRVYVRRGGKVPSSQPAMFHHHDMVAKVDVPLASVSESQMDEEREMVSYNQLGDHSNHACGPRVYVRKRKAVRQVL